MSSVYAVYEGNFLSFLMSQGSSPEEEDERHRDWTGAEVHPITYPKATVGSLLGI
jgi:hypothetical protein